VIEASAAAMAAEREHADEMATHLSSHFPIGG
jgi:hypothetical protein